ncbi:hypothetical protein Taro_038148 [Colocasia esculenta]|uniref:Uncharacterized protein n=1 Tax=Colocasia esculenta TaxID=4460 RepID=A0A843WRU3_COLES|nr:hypothetical protein [Colocasia esculenta]
MASSIISGSLGGYSAEFLSAEQQERFTFVKTKVCGNKAVDVANLEKNGMHSVVAAMSRMQWMGLSTFSEGEQGRFVEDAPIHGEQDIEKEAASQGALSEDAPMNEEQFEAPIEIGEQAEKGSPSRKTSHKKQKKSLKKMHLKAILKRLNNQGGVLDSVHSAVNTVIERQASLSNDIFQSNVTLKWFDKELSSMKLMLSEGHQGKSVLILWSGHQGLQFKFPKGHQGQVLKFSPLKSCSLSSIILYCTYSSNHLLATLFKICFLSPTSFLSTCLISCFFHYYFSSTILSSSVSTRILFSWTFLFWSFHIRTFCSSYRRPGGIQGVVPFGCEGRPGEVSRVWLFPSGVKEDQLCWVL